LDLLQGFAGHLNQACVGSISEIFDAQEPHTPRACIAQAWSVAEVLRSYLKLAARERGGEAAGGEPLPTDGR